MLAAVLTTSGACTGRGDGLKTLSIEVSGGGDAFSYTAPTTIDAGVYAVRLTNRTDTHQHLDVLRAEGGRGYQELDAALEAAGEGGPLPDYVSSPGGIGPVRPGATRSATLKLTEGTYFLHNSDALNPDDAESKSYDELGLVAELRVTGSSDDTIENRGALLVARDGETDTFDLPTFRSGTNAVTFRNDGSEFHHVVAAKMSDEVSIDDVRAFLESDDAPTGPLPVDLDGADYFAALDPGGKVASDLELTSGTYAFICFLSDKAGGPPHFTTGMLVEAKIP